MISEVAKVVPRIEQWLINYIAQILEINSSDVSVDSTFSGLGLDSSASAGLAGELSELIGKELEPTVVYEYPTIRILAAHVANLPH